jgi:hypothetical protein
MAKIRTEIYSFYIIQIYFTKSPLFCFTQLHKLCVEKNSFLNIDLYIMKNDRRFPKMIGSS